MATANVFDDEGNDFERVRFLCLGCKMQRDKIVAYKRGTKAPTPKYCSACKPAATKKSVQKYNRKIKKCLPTRLAFGSLTLLFLFLSGCAERFAEVRGSVWRNHIPVSGATVKVEDLSYYRAYETLTDGDGEFRLSRIIVGNLRRGILTVRDGDKMLHREYVNLPSIKLIQIE